ncbi:MAG: Spy/CpxP family protein refolding chaperone [Thermoanaerobaculia bacterium]
MTSRIRFRNFLAASLVLLATGGVLGGVLLAHDGRGAAGLHILGGMARHLDLTEDQKTRIRGIYESRSVQIQEQREARRNARRALTEAMHAAQRDEAVIRARAAELGRVTGEGAVLFSRIRAEIAPLLTDEQRQKLADMKGKVRERRGRRGDRF